MWGGGGGVAAPEQGCERAALDASRPISRPINPDPLIPSPAHYLVAVKELKLRYYIGETLLFTIYTHYGNLI